LTNATKVYIIIKGGEDCTISNIQLNIIQSTSTFMFIIVFTEKYYLQKIRYTVGLCRNGTDRQYSIEQQKTDKQIDRSTDR